MNSPETGPGLKVKAAEGLLHCTDHLLVVYDAMPVVNATSDYIDGGGMKGKGSFNSNSDSNSYGVTGNGDGDGDEERDFRTPV